MSWREIAEDMCFCCEHKNEPGCGYTYMGDVDSNSYIVNCLLNTIDLNKNMTLSESLSSLEKEPLRPSKMLIDKYTYNQLMEWGKYLIEEFKGEKQ